jgi:Zn-dependent M16 (insulinase) family peptidase
MSLENKCPAVALTAGERFHGFRVLRVEQIPDKRLTAYEMEHEKTGAKVLHLHCDDRENLYAIGFRTPPNDSTGVPHILEHSVLAGSKRFPLKDVFNELHKGTLQTFINAFTYPDKTIYPVASQVRPDFFNLARVYTDLVLRPRLLKESYYQEGHHLEFTDPDDSKSDLVISGIVYNEMKGAYSSPDRLMGKAIQENIFPDNAYAHDSGGDPEAIPRLTYEQFKAFHRTFYSPSNARIFLYGNIPTEDHLAFLAGMLDDFEKIDVESYIPSQKKRNKPVYVEGFYPLGREETTEKKTAVNCAWLLAENTDYETSLMLKITCGLLVGSSASPLYKALMESRLGEDLSPVTGLEQDFRQMFFTVGLRGTDADKSTFIEELIFGTLQKIYESGFDSALVEGALHQVEFHGKEITRGAMPYGIALMDAAFHTWLYDGDPLAGLNFSRAIDTIRRKWKENPAIFQEMVKEWLLDNPHRVISILEPSKTYNEEKEKAFKQKMEELKASLSDERLEEIRREAASLRSFQATPDTPDAIATLPRLKIGDLPQTIEVIPTESKFHDDIPILKHDIFTNGIVYLDIAFDIAHVPDELQPYLPLLARLATGMGAAGLDYEATAKRIALRTGSVSCHLAAGATADGRRYWQKMIFQVSSLHRNVEEAIKILRDILVYGDLSHKERMFDLIMESKNGLHASVVPSGHVFARRTAAAFLSLPAYRDEQWHGRTQLRSINRIADNGKIDSKELPGKLDYLRNMVFRKEKMTLNMTADEEGLSLLSEAAMMLIEELNKGEIGQSAAAISLPSPFHIGVAIPAQVSYVAKAFKAPPYSDQLAASLFVASKMLANDYLYKHIRVQGGAYGGMCYYEPLNCVFAFLSYRDPHIARTLQVYNKAADFIKGRTIKRENLEKAIIGTIGALDKPMDPSTRGYTSMIRNFSGLDDGMRLDLRHKILDMTEKVLAEDMSRFFAAVEKSPFVVAVYGEEKRLRDANAALETKLNVEPLA